MQALRHFQRSSGRLFLIKVPEKYEDAENDSAYSIIHDRERVEAFPNFYMLGLIETEENSMNAITAGGDFMRIEEQPCTIDALHEPLLNYGISAMTSDTNI